MTMPALGHRDRGVFGRRRHLMNDRFGGVSVRENKVGERPADVAGGSPTKSTNDPARLTGRRAKPNT